MWWQAHQFLQSFASRRFRGFGRPGSGPVDTHSKGPVCLVRGMRLPHVTMSSTCAGVDVASSSCPSAAAQRQRLTREELLEQLPRAEGVSQQLLLALDSELALVFGVPGFCAKNPAHPKIHIAMDLVGHTNFIGHGFVQSWCPMAHPCPCDGAIRWVPSCREVPTWGDPCAVTHGTKEPEPPCWGPSIGRVPLSLADLRVALLNLTQTGSRQLVFVATEFRRGTSTKHILRPIGKATLTEGQHGLCTQCSSQPFAAATAQLVTAFHKYHPRMVCVVPFTLQTHLPCKVLQTVQIYAG